MKCKNCNAELDSNSITASDFNEEGILSCPYCCGNSGLSLHDFKEDMV